jgi:hypothetical protein
MEGIRILKDFEEDAIILYLDSFKCLNKTCQWPHPQLQYGQVGKEILSLDYILMT